MCGRYARKSAQELLAEWFDLDLHLMPWFMASYNAWNHVPMTVNPITVLRRPGKSAGTDEFGREVFGLVAWRETDRFPRRRYNPDEIRPLFPSELHLRAAVAAAGGAGA